MNLEKYISLEKGHSLVSRKSYSKGTLQETDFYEYEELDSSGEVVAKYEAWDTTALKPPFHISKGYRKKNLNGETLKEDFNLQRHC